MPSGDTEYQSLPVEMSYNNNVVSISKCHAKGDNIEDDPECNDATEPFDKYFSLVYRVYLADTNYMVEGLEVFEEKFFQA